MNEEVAKYLKQLNPAVQHRMEELLTLASDIIEGGELCLSYGIPTIKYQGKNVIHFGAFTHHIGIYPKPGGADWNERLQAFKGGKGTLQIPHSENLPLNLIKDIVQYRFRTSLSGAI